MCALCAQCSEEGGGVARLLEQREAAPVVRGMPLRLAALGALVVLAGQERHRLRTAEHGILLHSTC